MLAFLAILGVSVLLVLGAQALDIECANPRQRRRVRSHGAPAKAAFPEGAVAGALR
jgi:hypothetical protein